VLVFPNNKVSVHLRLLSSELCKVFKVHNLVDFRVLRSSVACKVFKVHKLADCKDSKDQSLVVFQVLNLAVSPAVNLAVVNSVNLPDSKERVQHS
jgi:hypothetical protein